MSTLVFSITTIRQDWESLSLASQKVLSHWIEEARTDDEDVELQLEALKAGLGYSPFTGSITTLAIYDIAREEGVVYYSGNGDKRRTEIGNFIYKERTESEMLAEFWEGVRAYDVFVTWNGRRFGIPFLMHRSAIHTLRPTRNLLEGRYAYQQKSCRHVDLQDELTFYGALARRPSLQMACEAYGIDSLSGVGITVAIVEEYIREKRYLDLAQLSALDVLATSILFERWQKYLNFEPLPGEL